MKELTLKKKIEFCELYLQNENLTSDNCFICNRFENYYGDGRILYRDYDKKRLKEAQFKMAFPELYKMVMQVGKTTWKKEEGKCYTFGLSWIMADKIAVPFRKEKIQELLDGLNLNN